MNPLLVKAVAASSRAAARRAVMSRTFTTTRVQLDASVFKMPAMSPTMTEGGIVDWKFKEGDSFSAGDVLLEIETDKAQIDVEAQDDGVLAKIYAQNGNKNIQVGDGIAAVAEPGDDLGAIDIPAADSVKAEAAPKQDEPQQQQQQEPQQESKKEAKAPSSAKASGSTANPDQTLLPSVAGLLTANSITRADALDKIPASGPSGRLLKGDVLAYLGTISQEAVNTITDNIKSTQHLDLSNIKVKAPEEAPAKPEEAKAAQEEEEAKPAKPEPTVLRATISLTDINLLRATVESTYESQVTPQQLVGKACKLAKQDVPYLARPRPSVLNDPVFDDLVTPRVTNQAPYSVSLDFASNVLTAQNKKGSDDAFDLLTSAKKPVSRPQPKPASPQLVNVAVTVNDKVPHSLKKAQIYLDRLQYYLSAGKGDLVL